jgi:hypothetical protein
MEETACPQPGCTMPAEIVDRRLLESTDDPIEHVRLVCLAGHRFLMPAEMLRGQVDPSGQHVAVPRDTRGSPTPDRCPTSPATTAPAALPPAHAPRSHL